MGKHSGQRQRSGAACQSECTHAASLTAASERDRGMACASELEVGRVSVGLKRLKTGGKERGKSGADFCERLGARR